MFGNTASPAFSRKDKGRGIYRYYRGSCTDTDWNSFLSGMDYKMLQVNALLIASAIMAGVIVGIGAYGQRYRHHPLTRFILLGATTLFLPIISSVVYITSGFDSGITSRDNREGAAALNQSIPALIAQCDLDQHSILVVTWALLVQNVMINNSVIIAVDDREGPSIGPPIDLLAQGAWTIYLGINRVKLSVDAGTITISKSGITLLYLLVNLPFVIIFAKLVFKYYAFKKAHKSFAFGRNPRLVFGYVQQLPPLTVVAGEPGSGAPPPLLVMGEETRRVNKQPHGYAFKDEDGSGMTTMLRKDGIGLVTMDRVWQLLDSPSSLLLLPAPTAQSLKDLCLSFAFFKLLRCRFARYELAHHADNTFVDFFWTFLLKDDGDEPGAGRVFGVITDELSFLHDYYNTSLPISYSKCWLPIVGIAISLLSIGYCIFLVVWMALTLQLDWVTLEQIWCLARCDRMSAGATVQTNVATFGSLSFDVVPLLLLSVFVVTAEAKDMISYICSNWTKIVLTCCLVNSRIFMCKWFSAHLVQRRCKLMMKQYSDGKMGQCSVLPLHPRATPLALVRRLLRLPDQKTNLSAAVKVSIVDALRSSRNGRLSNGKASLCRWGQDAGVNFLWACSSKSSSDIILTWHIATSVLEVRYPSPADPQQGSSSIVSDHRSVATRLSRYCAYLVALCPELLPDDDAWSKSLYGAVSRDARRALAGSSPSMPGYQQLVQLLTSAKSKHGVLKNGAELGKQLVETFDGEETAWKLLAGFWSEMVLYVAPSDNLRGHKDSIARGGELITLLWALLNHAGIVSRATSSDNATCSSPAAERPGDASTSAGVV